MAFGGSLSFVMVILILVNFTLCYAHSPVSECKKRLNEATVLPTLQHIGVEMMKMYERGSKNYSFVYSELKIFHKFIQLLSLGSESARSNIKSVIDLSDDTECDEYYCEAFSEILNDISKSVGHNFVYESYLFYQYNKTLITDFGQCGTLKRMDFTMDTEDIILVLSEAYDFMSERSFYEIFDPIWDRRTDFYLLSGIRLRQAIFNVNDCYRSLDPFIDLDGKEHNLAYYEMKSNFWYGEKYLISIEGVRTIRLIYGEINKNSLYMLYFHPLFTEEDNLSTKSKCIQDIFADLRQYINDTVSKRGSEARNISTVATPYMYFHSETNLRHILASNLTELLYPDQITNLYNHSTTAYELRTWEYRYNEGTRGCYFLFDYPGDHSGHRMDSPFVFVIMDKATNIILKTGAYLRPKYPFLG